LTPHEVTVAALTGATVVVVDILRATTSMIWALDAGARRVWPVATVPAACALAKQLGPHCLLAGERGGLPLDGFDLGNSPSEFTPEQVTNRDIVMTTTNGTTALLHAQQARQVLIGAFANLSAVAEALRGSNEFHVLCAGTNGAATDEDSLFAGALMDRCLSADPDLSLSSQRTRQAWEQWRSIDQADLVGALRVSAGGRNLCQINQPADIQDAAIIDRCDCVPRYHHELGVALDHG
jgi:2-phosphosulfolactate phosphatase